eukprot:9472700-Pyramimonas_sp.AAC.4
MAPIDDSGGEYRQITKYDVIDFFGSCVLLRAHLTDTYLGARPSAGSPFGPEVIGIEDGQGGPR